jgi:hypothetical protein
VYCAVLCCVQAAHQGKCERRNEDAAEIVRGVRMGPWRMDFLHQFEHVFWMGDLNYRLDFGSQGDEKEPGKELFNSIVDKIRAKKFDELFAADQLLRERKAGRAFVGFTEGQYAFAPTFKTIKGKVDEYNEARSPAYCDRILWKSFPGHTVQQTAFGSVPAIVTSDHKPVYGRFTVRSFVLPPARDPTLGAATLTITNVKRAPNPHTLCYRATRSDPVDVLCVCSCRTAEGSWSADCRS